MAANGAGGYVVAWQEGATNSDIAAAVMDRTGQVLGGGVEALAAVGNTQERPALAYDTARGRYLAVWADYRNSAEDPDVYGKKPASRFRSASCIPVTSYGHPNANDGAGRLFPWHFPTARGGEMHGSFTETIRLW